MTRFMYARHLATRHPAATYMAFMLALATTLQLALKGGF